MLYKFRTLLHPSSGTLGNCRSSLWWVIWDGLRYPTRRPRWMASTLSHIVCRLSSLKRIFFWRCELYVVPKFRHHTPTYVTQQSLRVKASATQPPKFEILHTFFSLLVYKFCCPKIPSPYTNLSHTTILKSEDLSYTDPEVWNLAYFFSLLVYKFWHVVVEIYLSSYFTLCWRMFQCIQLTSI